MVNEKNTKEIINYERDLLLHEVVKAKSTTDTKKISFAEDLKKGMGETIIKEINNPNRHNPSDLSFWEKIKKALGC